MMRHEERSTTDQAMAVAGSFMCNVDWASVTQKEARKFIDDPMKGEMGAAFVKSGRDVFFGRMTKLPIDRTEPYDPATYPSDVWRISEEDERSLALTEIDPNDINLMAPFRFEADEEIDGDVNLRRLKRYGHVRLDAKILQMFWENKHLIPESWKEKVGDFSRLILFDGTILSCGDDRISLYLHWNGRGWERKFRNSPFHRAGCMPSAVLK